MKYNYIKHETLIGLAKQIAARKMYQFPLFKRVHPVPLIPYHEGRLI